MEGMALLRPKGMEARIGSTIRSNAFTPVSGALVLTYFLTALCRRLGIDRPQLWNRPSTGRERNSSLIVGQGGFAAADRCNIVGTVSNGIASPLFLE